MIFVVVTIVVAVALVLTLRAHRYPDIEEVLREQAWDLGEWEQ